MLGSGIAGWAGFGLGATGSSLGLDRVVVTVAPAAKALAKPQLKEDE